MNTTVLVNLAQAYSQTATETVFGGAGVLGLGVALLSLALSVLLTWAILRTTLVVAGAPIRERRPTPNNEESDDPTQKEQNEKKQKKHTSVLGPFNALIAEGFALITLGNLLNALWETLLVYLRGLFGAIKDAGMAFLTEWPIIIGLLFVIAGCFVWLEFHEIILDVSFEAIQCKVRPIVDGFIFPFLNGARLVYSLWWPIVDASADVFSALTWGNIRTFIMCVDASVFTTFFQHLGLGFRDLTGSFATMVTQILSDGRWDMLPGLIELGDAFNATRAVWDCYCPDAGPIVDFVYAIPTAPSLYVAIDCTSNTGIRLVQIGLNLVFNFQAPNTTLWAEEATCATFAWGAYVEDIGVQFVDFLFGVLAILEELTSTSAGLVTPAARSAMYTRLVGLHALASSTLDIPPAVQAMSATPGAVPGREYMLLSMNAIDTSIVAAYGQKASLFGEVDPLIKGATNIDSLPNISLITHLGLEALARLAASPWSGLFTGPVAVVIGAVNLTTNAVCHPFQAFGYQEGIAFFQYGVLGDYTRLVAIAAAELLSFFSDTLPCTFSKPLQALVSTGEMLAELATGTGYAAQFPPWQMGDPPPYNCSVVNCSRPPPEDWRWTDALSAYAEWNTSRLSRNLQLIEEGGECTAYLLGCNTTADNNNSTNTTSNCTDAPLACTARSLNRVAVSVLNLTFNFLLNAPTLLQFNANKTTFADLPIAATQLAIEDFLICLGLLIDEFDPSGNMCLTPEPPGPQPPGGPINLPPDDPIGVFGVPPRTEWECRLDGGAYYWDGRQVVVLNTSDIYDLNSSQYRCEITDSRQCVIAESKSSAVEVLGSAPEDNETLVVWPTWVVDAGGQPLVMVYNATTGTSLVALPNATELEDTYNVSSVTEEDCTSPDPPPPLLSPVYACSPSSSATFYLSPFSRDAQTYIASFVYTDLAPAPGPGFACTSAFPSTYTCDSDGVMHITTPDGERVIYYQNLTETPLVDRPVECFPSSAPPVTPEDIVCQYNTLAYLAGNPPFTYTTADPLYWPVFYYPDASVSSTRLPLACENTPPAGYVCEGFLGSDVGIMTADPTSSRLQTSDIDGFIYYMPCVNNTLTVAPKCTRITVEYTTGPETVVIELEGGEVRVWTNDTKEAVPCMYQGITNGTAAVASVSAAMKVEDEAVAASAEGINLHTLVRQAQETIAARYATRGAHAHRPIVSGASVSMLENIELLGRVDPARYSGATLLKQTLLIRQALVFGANVTVYRIKSLLCCFSEVVTTGGEFFVETFYAVAYLLQGILTLPADPSYSVELPTFAASRDAFRDALCALGCELMAFLPFTLSCPGSAGGTCGDLTTCGRNFLCDVGDVIIVGVDFFVNLLTMIRALLLGQSPPPGSNILGTSCSAGDPSKCLTSFIVTVIVSPIQATMQAARTLAGVGDCLLCALARVVAPTTHCYGPFFAIVNTLASVIDMVALTLVTAIVNLGLGIVQFFIYFFAGQFGQAWNALSTYVLDFLFSLFRNFAVLILEALKKLPIIGPIISNILSFFNTACTTVSDILTQFGGRPLECLSVGLSLKRSPGQAPETQWLAPLRPNVTAVWAVGGAAAGACGASMAALNATDLYDAADNALHARELAFCVAAHLWVGPTATAAADPSVVPFPHPCDSLMPTVYARGQPLHTLDAGTQARAIECVDARLRAEYVRAENGYSGTWVPHDLYYPGSFSSVAQLTSDAMFAHDIWTQYKEDRLAVASELVSQEYAAAWSASGYDTSHLASLAENPGASAASVYDKVLSDQGAFSLEAYARRAIEAENKKRDARLLFGRMPSVERVVGIARSLWEPIFSPTGHPVFRDEASGEPISLVGEVMQSLFKKMQSRIGASSISVPLTRNTFARMFEANDTRLLHQTQHGVVSAIADFGSVLVATARALTPAPLLGSSKRSALWAIVEVPREFFYALRGGFSLAAEYLSGKAGVAHRWLTNNVTQAWLRNDAHNIRLREPLAAGAGILEHKSLVSTGAESLLNGFTRVLSPFARQRPAWSAFASGALRDDGPIGAQGVSSASERRMRMSRLAAKALLIRGDEAKNAAFYALYPKSLRAQQVSNITGDTCLFAYTNSTTNVTTYPFCDTCPGADQILGRIQRAVYAVLFNFGYESPTCPNCTLDGYPSLNYSRQQAAEFDAYIRNPNAVVVVGDSPELPVGFPSKQYSSWRYLDDPTPDKRGFADLRALWDATIAYFRTVVPIPPEVAELPTLERSFPRRPNTLERIRARWNDTSTRSDSPLHAPMHAFVLAAGTSSWEWLLASGKDAAEQPSVTASTAVPDPGPFTSLGQVLRAWFNYVLSFFLCPYPSLFLNGKRFSLGETLVLGAGIFFILWCIGIALFRGQLVLTGLVAGTVTTLLIFGFWLLLTYDYGLLCLVNAPPALPVGFGDDGLYLLAFNLFPKCSLLYGVVNEAYYSNSNCYPCANWEAGMFTVPNFYQSFANGGRFGFSDLRYNIAFILRAAFPTLYWSLRPGGTFYNFPILGALLRSSFFQTPLAAYEAFDPETVPPTAYRQFWQGGTWVTLPANFFLLAGILYLVTRLFGPFIVQTLALILAMILLILPLLLFIFAGMFSVMSFGMVDDLALLPGGNNSAEYDPIVTLKKDFDAQREKARRKQEQQQQSIEMQRLPVPPILSF
jgi:hypothetical protein